jgi:hypothetical protein
MKKAKEKLVSKLMKNSNDLFDQFVVVGLEDTLETIIGNVSLLLEKGRLQDHQTSDLIDLYHDGKATVSVLRYYSVSPDQKYLEEVKILNKAWDKFMQEMS